MDTAIRTFVHPGSSIFVAGMQHGEPCAAVQEIVRQRIGGLTVVPALTQTVALLVGEGLVATLMHAYTTDLYERRGYAFQKARARGTFPRLVEFSHFGLCLALLAGQFGVPFLPNATQIGSDLERENPEHITTVDCPFTGRRLGAVRAITPDVGIVHVQRADATGNAQKLGSLGMDPMGLHASRQVIVSTERVVDPDEIRRTPEHTLIPGFLVNAVVEEPFGAYPLHLAGCYSSDVAHYRSAMETGAGYEAYLRDYVYGRNSHGELLNWLEITRGPGYLDRLRVPDSPEA